MNKFGESLKEYRKNNNISDEQALKLLELDDKKYLEDIESEKVKLSKTEIKNISDKIGMKYMSTGKRIIKSLDLIFRLGAFIMAIVTLLLCISQNINDKTLIVLLAISMLCNSMILLPKIDK